MALAPHLKPDFLSSIIAEYLPNGGELPEFGGIKTKNHRGILSTGETAQFLIAGLDSLFDEADAVFGKRTNVRDTHDKYANQEVSYLLQRIENHSGLVILASNFKTNIDTAFT